MWGYYLAPHTYAFRAFMYNEFSNLPQEFSGECLAFQSGEDVLTFYGMEDVVIWKDALVLVGWVVALQTIFFLVLKYKWGKGQR